MKLFSISFINILDTDVIWQNPDFNFVSPYYDENLKILDNGRTVSLANSIRHDDPIVFSDPKKFRRRLFIEQFIVALVLSFVSTFITSIIRIGDSFLFNEPGFWKYIILQLSILSVFFIGATSLMTIYCFKREWTQRCILNSSIFKDNLTRKCSVQVAIKDLANLFSKEYISSLETKLPHKSDYLNDIVKSFAKYDNNTNFKELYNKELSKINNSPNIFTSIVSLIIGVLIELFSFIDLYSELETFRANLIVIAIIIIVFSIIASITLVKSRFANSYIKLDGITYLYSYMYLKMPYDCNSIEQSSIEIPILDNEEIEPFKECFIYALNSCGVFLFNRQVEIDGTKLTIYGKKLPTDLLQQAINKTIKR